MLVADIMTRHVVTCRKDDTLDVPARLMWDHDCGAIPVTDGSGRTVAMITDRDICMAAYIRGQPLRQIGVMVAASRHLHSVRPDASVAVAYEIMKRHRVRRLPVIDLGGALVGMLSLADVVRNARRASEPSDALDVEQVAVTMAEVFRTGRTMPPPASG
jgi:CBS domain-containing protein